MNFTKRLISFALTATLLVLSFSSCKKEKNAMVDYGNYKSDGEYVLFGHYLQSVDPDVEDLTQDGDLYRAKNGDLYGRANPKYVEIGGYEWYDGADEDDRLLTFVGSDELYFKLEPLRWEIIAEEEGRMLLWCEELIDARRFDKSGNALYSDSEIREWLNGDFLADAFTPAEREVILDTKIAEGESDKVFLLTKEAIEGYGIERDQKRKSISSYAYIARSSYQGAAKGGANWKYKCATAQYWITTEDGKSLVLYNGDYVEYNNSNENIYVVPAVWISTD